MDGTPVTSTAGAAVWCRPSFEPWRSGWPLVPLYGGRLDGGGRLSLVPRDGLERGGDWPPARGQVRCPRARRRLATRSRVGSLSSSEVEMCLRGRGSRGEPSSEAEMSDPLEGRSATLERGGDCSVGLRGVRMGHMLGFFESFPLFRIWKEAGGLRGPSCLNRYLCFLKRS